MTEVAELTLAVDSRPAEAGAKRTEAALGGVSKAAGNLQRTLLGLAGGLGAAKLFGDFAKQTSALETSIRRIGQLQGLGGTAKALKEVEGALKGLRSNFFDRGDLAAGALEATRANFDLADSLKVTAAAQGLARDTGLELARATGLVATSLRSLGQGAGGAGNLAGALGLVANLDASGVESLVGILQKVGPEARQVTVEMDELLAAFKVADGEGQSFSTTGRDLVGILNALEAPTKDSNAALAQLGLTFADIDPRARRLDEIFAKLAARGASTAQLTAIFGQGNSATASALVRNAENLAKALEDVRNAASGEGAGGARNISEAIQGIANAYNDLLIAGGNSGGASVIVGTLDTIREALRDIAGVGEQVGVGARALEGLVAGFIAYKTAVGVASAATRLFNVALAGTPFGLVVTGLVAATTAAVAFREELGLVEKKTREVSALQKTPQLGRELLASSGLALAGASFDGPFSAIAEQSKAAVFDLQRSIADATKTALVDGLASPQSTQEVLRALEGTLKAFASDPNRNAAEAAGAILSESLIQGLVGPDSALNSDQQDAIRRSLEGITGGSSAAPAAQDTVDSQSRIAEALRLTTEAAEREAAQMEALNEALRLENALGVERSFLGISEQARAVAEQVEVYRQTLVAAGVTSDEAAARLSTYANGVQQLADAQAAATRSAEDFAAAQAALAAVEGAVASLEFERAAVGKTAEEVERLRRELEFAKLANDAFGEGSSAAAQAIEEYGKDLADLQAAQKAAADAERERADAAKRAGEAQREAAEASRRAIQEQQRAAEDLARAFTGPVQSSIDSYVEALLKGEKASIDFRDVAAEIGAGVFRETVTKPLTEKATGALATFFGGGNAQQVDIQAAVVNVNGLGGASSAVPGASNGFSSLAGLFGGSTSGSGGTPAPAGGGSSAATLGAGAQLASTFAAGGGGTTAPASTAEQAQTSVQPTSGGNPNATASTVGTAATGAQIGTAILPGIGTAVGLVAGALLGYYAAGGFGSRHGNAFHRGRLIPHANGGIVDKLSAFPLAGGRFGTLAEDGPEAILPLRRGRGGRLGVEVSGGDGGRAVVYQTTVNQNIRTPDTVGFRRQASSLAVEQRRVQKRQQSRRT